MANQNDNEIDEFDFTGLNEQELNNIEEDLNNKLVHDLQDLENIEYDFSNYGNHMHAAVTFFEKVYRSL